MSRCSQITKSTTMNAAVGSLPNTWANYDCDRQQNSWAPMLHDCMMSNRHYTWKAYVPPHCKPDREVSESAKDHGRGCCIECPKMQHRARDDELYLLGNDVQIQTKTTNLIPILHLALPVINHLSAVTSKCIVPVQLSNQAKIRRQTSTKL